MSNEAARGIDPRFDPRFQRGYTPDAAATASPQASVAEAATEPALAEPAAGRASQRRETGIRAEPAVGREVRPPERVVRPDQLDDDHAAALLAYFGPPADRAAAPDAAESDEPQHRGRIGPSPAPAEPAGSGFDRRHGEHVDVDADSENESPFVRHPSLAFWVALAASIGFVVVGVVVSWNVSLEQMRPTGRMSGAETQAFLSALSALGMGLVQAGALGTVVVLAIWAVQSGRRRHS